MNRALRAPKVIVLAGFVLIAAVLVASVMAGPAGAHGSTQSPASRVYTCRFENPDNPMCATAWASNSQALYDWMEVNIGDAAGRHQELIPDGQLCSAGREKYAAFDQPGGWPVTALRADGSGLVDLVYENTAPHSTEYYRVYITRQGFDARTDPLAWADLELAHDSGRLDRASQQRMRAALPNREVPAILYIVWQRSDSPEAFYACSDVTVSGGSTNPPVSPTSTPSTSAPTTPSTTPQTTGAPSTTAPTTVAAPPTTAPPTFAPPTTRAPTTRPPTTRAPRATAPPPTPTPTRAPGTSAGQTSAAPPEHSGSTATTPATSAGAASPETETDDEMAVGQSDGRSTGSSSPGATLPNAVNPTAQIGDAAVGDTVLDPADSGSATANAGLTIEAPLETSAGTSGSGRAVLLAIVVGIGSAGLVALGLGLRWSDQLPRLLGLLGGRPAARTGPGPRRPARRAVFPVGSK